MFNIITIRRLRCLCFRLRWPIRRRRSGPKVVIRKFGNYNKQQYSPQHSISGSSAAVHPRAPERRVRVATFNAALFSMAPAMPKPGANRSPSLDFDVGCGGFMRAAGMSGEAINLRAKSMNDRPKPKSILKQANLRSDSLHSAGDLTKQQKLARSKPCVSINLPDNEISLLRSRQPSFREDGTAGDPPNHHLNSSSAAAAADAVRISRGKAPETSTSSKKNTIIHTWTADDRQQSCRSPRTVLEVLMEVDADILALQHVKAQEENNMKPLSDLATALGMSFVFAESWAPEYGNAVLSKWPIKRWETQKILDDTDFRNVLKATIEVPRVGEMNFYCTYLDHLDENWRMKQIKAIIQSTDQSPHILAGGLNSLDETDYSQERWSDIVKACNLYYEDRGKPTPKAEVMRFLKGREYVDSKDFAGECEPVVMIAKGQSVQGTCKYGTRVDYIMASPDSLFRFVPGSYSVYSSKGTSDHHIVKVDIVRSAIAYYNQGQHNKNMDSAAANKIRRQSRHNNRHNRVIKITDPSFHQPNGVWKNAVTQNSHHNRAGKLMD
ncbi:hypothetical protein SAY86_020133 [Trapa natans]|uniref:Endonuclease/exonuclease/phosphatase domain-containing protein n=1 Tax=Trapa natans TaxID=22666 RepID=A0AAN7LPA8_TRANT|nr:hypothetical protein SAY86_020133 [Trapa natans]